MITHPLLSLAEYKSLTNDLGESPRDAMTKFILKSATLSIQNFCRRNFTRQTFTDTFNTQKNYKGNYVIYDNTDDYDSYYAGTEFYTIPIFYRLTGINVDLAQPIEVVLDRSIHRNVTLTQDQYDIIDSKLLIKERVNDGYKNLKISYVAGFPFTTVNDETYLTNVPDDLKIATYITAQKMESTVNSASCSPEKDEKAAYTVFGIPQTATSLLINYRRSL